MRILKKTGKFCGMFALLICILLIISATYNFFQQKKDLASIGNYGKEVTVKGKKMNVCIEGTGEQTIVLLPGFGTASPILDFKGLTDELKSDYRVVVVEPFGYGLSDVIDEERTIEAMNEELHMCLQQLDINQYLLGGHSIAGVYGLRYINQYPDEVTGYIGLDTSVPYQINQSDIPTWIYPLLKNTGLYRLLLNLGPQSYQLQGLSEEENEQTKKLALTTLGNQNIISEGKLFKQNLSTVQDLFYPDDLPVIFFLASESVEAHDFWVSEHEKMTENLKYSSIEVIDGAHYIHHLHEQEIKQKIDAFFGKWIQNQ